MQKTILAISSLLAGIGIMLFGNGLLGTLLSLRGIAEGYPENTIGLIMSMYFMGFIAGTFLCPKIIRRVGHIRTLAILAATSSGASIVQGLWVDAVSWSIMRFISGICIVGIFMVIESWLNAQASNENRGRVFAIYILVNLVFLAGGQFLILTGDIRALDLFAIAAALFSLSLIPVALTRLPEPAPVRDIKISIGNLYRTSPLGFAGCFISGVVGSAFWGLAPLFAYQAGFTEAGIAIFMSVTILGGIVLQLPIGLWSDKHDRRTSILITALLSAAVSLLALLFIAEASPGFYICMFLYGGMMFSMYPLSVAHANDHPEVDDYVTTSTNLLLVYGIGAALGPAIGGWLMYQFGHFSLLLFFAAAGIFLGIFANYRRRRGIKIPIEQQTDFVPLSRTSQAMADGLYQEDTAAGNADTADVTQSGPPAPM